MQQNKYGEEKGKPMLGLVGFVVLDELAERIVYLLASGDDDLCVYDTLQLRGQSRGNRDFAVEVAPRLIHYLSAELLCPADVLWVIDHAHGNPVPEADEQQIPVLYILPYRKSRTSVYTCLRVWRRGLSNHPRTNIPLYHEHKTTRSRMFLQPVRGRL